jgi:hypothetical protein
MKIGGQIGEKCYPVVSKYTHVCICACIGTVGNSSAGIHIARVEYSASGFGNLLDLGHHIFFQILQPSLHA